MSNHLPLKLYLNYKLVLERLTAIIAIAARTITIIKRLKLLIAVIEFHCNL